MTGDMISATHDDFALKHGIDILNRFGGSEVGLFLRNSLGGLGGAGVDPVGFRRSDSDRQRDGLGDEANVISRTCSWMKLRAKSKSSKVFESFIQRAGLSIDDETLNEADLVAGLTGLIGSFLRLI